MANMTLLEALKKIRIGDILMEVDDCIQYFYHPITEQLMQRNAIVDNAIDEPAYFNHDHFHDEGEWIIQERKD
jgi:hypothetical protein